MFGGDLNLRPELIPAHEWDEAERVTFGDREIISLRGGFASIEVRDDNLYFAAQLRNIGGGLGVLTAWWMDCDPEPSLDMPPDLDGFNAQLEHAGDLQLQMHDAAVILVDRAKRLQDSANAQYASVLGPR